MGDLYFCIFIIHCHFSKANSWNNRFLAKTKLTCCYYRMIEQKKRYFPCNILYISKQQTQTLNAELSNSIHLNQIIDYICHNNVKYIFI